MGTHTTCIQIRTPESEFLVDAGTGLLEWSRQSSASSAAGKPSTSEGHLFLTHAHLDHVCSLPFADIFYHEAANFTIWGLPEVLSELQSILSHDDPRAARMFPMALRDLKGIRSMQPIVPGQSVVIRGTRVDAARLCHPGGSLAYRFQRENRRVVIATDHEHAAGDDITLVEFAANANLLYLDAQYRDAEYRGEKGIGTQPPRNRSGWGHSTLEASLRTAALANVATLHLGHHDPNRSDQELFALREQLLQGAESEEMRESPAHLGLPRPPRIDLAQDGMSFTVE
jgi:phosphoribosyl 1,2-cyclic phosphodiesterase